MINIPNNDGDIEYRDDVIVELTQLMTAQKPIDISLNGEGPCADSLGLYNLLDVLSNKLNYDKKNITITTCNLIETHPEYNIKITPQITYLQFARNFANSSKLQNKKFAQGFKHFGNFIGHGNIHRLHIASYLHRYYKDKTLQSYHYNRHKDYHKMFIGLEDMLSNSYSFDEIDCSYEFLKQTPISQDSIDTYPILNPATLNITKVYHNFFVEIVNLSYFSGNTFYIDEKIWRPMIMKTPFLIQGPKNYIINLRKLGFKTFDTWWNEGYSEDLGRCQADGIFTNLEKLSKYSVQELEKTYSDMMPTLDHNYQLLMSLRPQDFLIGKK